MRCELCRKRRAEHMHHFHHGIHRKTPVGEVVNGFPQRLIPLCMYCHADCHTSHSRKFKERHGRERGDFIYIRGESQTHISEFHFSDFHSEITNHKTPFYDSIKKSQPAGIPDAGTIPAEW